MSDVALNRFVATGDTAARSAFTPDPPSPASGPDNGYLWYDTDDGTLYAWDGAAWAPAVVGGTGDVTGPAASIASEIALFDGTTGKLLKRMTGSGWVKVASGVAAVVANIRTVGIVIDGAGSAITTGVKGYVRFPMAGTITKVTVLSIDGTGPATVGSIVVDVWKDTYANYPPTVADSITASAKPTLSAANKSEDATLTGWTTSVTAGDVFGFNVDSAATVTRVIVEIEVTT